MTFCSQINANVRNKGKTFFPPPFKTYDCRRITFLHNCFQEIRGTLALYPLRIFILFLSNVVSSSFPIACITSPLKRNYLSITDACFLDCLFSAKRKRVRGAIEFKLAEINTFPAAQQTNRRGESTYQIFLLFLSLFFFKNRYSRDFSSFDV